jgi:hypothetical protein
MVLDPADVGVEVVALLLVQCAQLWCVLLFEQLLCLTGVEGRWVPFEELVQLLMGEVPARRYMMTRQDAKGQKSTCVSTQCKYSR